MFRGATVKIAHSSTIPVPALIGNEELKPLQDLITAEKSVLASLQRLSSDFLKAADSMRTWAISEGDDLSDILNSSRTLLAHFSGALNCYSSIQNIVRDNMKAVRTREESLDNLQRRRRRTAASVESIRKKLARMTQETKAFDAQMDALNISREALRHLDAKIAHERSTIVAFKRKCTKNWLTLKFGGLVECCEKGMIIGETGKRMAVVEERRHQELSESPKHPYVGQEHMTSLLSEAQHRIVQVVFSGTPSGSETPETPHPPISQSRPDCFKDLPEIRDEPFAAVISVDHLPSNSHRSSLDHDMMPAPVHVLSGIGPSTTYTPDYGCRPELSLSCSELSLAPSRRRTTGNCDNRRYSALARSRFFPGFRLDSIAEGDEPSPSPSSMSSDIGHIRSCLSPIGPHTANLETT
ncbi:uncharacterized protein EDB93DRAFT_1253799 [Suillus bovinus]|uniref:uncharacterized protein n=1 Tax=Suillus bovinus TaxID=48563 RepID=UPI001B8733D0|nr:uncharacterized protein EDB93DRAFT_1253799 [Suillus bovinus]KAG2136939.1 hypothetical protein EDB93DRAFT_1253799 [Suillus bovinus]